MRVSSVQVERILSRDAERTSDGREVLPDNLPRTPQLGVETFKSIS